MKTYKAILEITIEASSFTYAWNYLETMLRKYGVLEGVRIIDMEESEKGGS